MAAPLLFTADKKERFLQALEETCSVQDAAASVGVDRRTANDHRRKDMEFSKQWDEALNRALDDLLGVAHKRAVHQKSDRLLEVLLKFRYGDKLADRLNVQVEGSVGLRVETLLMMDETDRVQLAALLDKYQRIEQSLVLEHDDGRHQ